jgi:hypothetical protein
MTSAWANAVDESLAELWDQNDKGNALMKKIDEKVDNLTARATPVIEAMEHMQVGIRVIGAVGAFVGRCADFLWLWGRRGVRAGLAIGALWLFGKLVLTGHPLSEAWEVVLKAVRP